MNNDDKNDNDYKHDKSKDETKDETKDNGESAIEKEEQLFLASMAEMDRLSKSKLARAKGGASVVGNRRGGARRLERRMRLRDFEPDQRIDLHGLDRRSAREALLQCLDSGIGSGVEVLLVIHGKGRRVLEQLVCRELDDHEGVVEHLSASRRLGGSGARLVRLRRPVAKGKGTDRKDDKVET